MPLLATNPARVGQRLPNVDLAKADGDAIVKVNLERLLWGRRVVLVGLPGAFTPVCTGSHVPELIETAPRLKASGFDEIILVAPNSPWVIAEWAGRMDPQGRLTFLSDGNLELAAALGLTADEPDLYLGRCSKRFSMIVHKAVVERLAVEPRVEMFGCTSPKRLLEAA